MKLILILSLILGLAGCTCNTAEDDMQPIVTGKNGWSASGQLITGNPDVKVILQASFIENPTNYTIQFGLRKPVPGLIIGGQGGIVQPVAEVVWTVEGNDVRRLVNIVNGLSMTGTAQSVKVTMWDNLREGQGGFVPGEEYVGAILVSPGSRASLDHAPTLIPESYVQADSIEHVYAGAVTLFPADFVAFDIPENAGVVSVMPWYSGNKDVVDGDVFFGMGNNTDNYFQYNLQRNPLWVPVPAACSRIFMRNDSTETIEVGVVFAVDG